MSSEQLDIFDSAPVEMAPLVEEPVVEGATIQERFERFDELNPWVYRQLVALARDMVARGRRHLGIGMLWEVLRWQYYRQTVDPSSDFKLNDHYRSRYARKIMETEADLDDVFELRLLRTP